MIDLSIPRKFYWSSKVNNTYNCPRCQSELINEYLPYLVLAQFPDKVKFYFIMGNKGGSICPNCQTIILDYKIFEENINEHDIVSRLVIIGLVDINSLSVDLNSPIPIIPFTNSIIELQPRYPSKKGQHNDKTREKDNISENSLFLCGSGKKYNNCCIRRKRITLKTPKKKDLINLWTNNGIENILECTIPYSIRREIFSYLKNIFSFSPEDNADILKTFINEILFNRDCSEEAGQAILDKYELEIDISKNELNSVKDFFPEMLDTLKDVPGRKYHPFYSLLSCILLNNVPNVTDQLPNVLDFIKSLSPKKALYYAHWLIDIGLHKPELLIPLMEEIIAMGIDEENILLVLSLIAKESPDKLIDLVPRVMKEPKNKYKYSTYRFLSSFAQKRPAVLTPYIDRLKEEQNYLTDYGSRRDLQECLSYYNQNIES